MTDYSAELQEGFLRPPLSADNKKARDENIPGLGQIGYPESMGGG
jgi:hypothetical protein